MLYAETNRRGRAVQERLTGKAPRAIGGHEVDDSNFQ